MTANFNEHCELLGVDAGAFSIEALREAFDTRRDALAKDGAGAEAFAELRKSYRALLDFALEIKGTDIHDLLAVHEAAPPRNAFLSFLLQQKERTMKTVKRYQAKFAGNNFWKQQDAMMKTILKGNHDEIEALPKGDAVKNLTLDRAIQAAAKKGLRHVGRVVVDFGQPILLSMIEAATKDAVCSKDTRMLNDLLAAPQLKEMKKGEMTLIDIASLRIYFNKAVKAGLTDSAELFVAKGFASALSRDGDQIEQLDKAALQKNWMLVAGMTHHGVAPHIRTIRYVGLHNRDLAQDMIAERKRIMAATHVFKRTYDRAATYNMRRVLLKDNYTF